MTNFTWREFDAHTASVGDMIIDQGTIAYVIHIEERGFSNPRFLNREKRVTLGEYRHEFFDDEERLSGYSFDCFADGTIPEPSNYHNVKDDPNLIDGGIQYYERDFKTPATMKCVCGEIVYMDNVMTNTCGKCARDYSIGGSLLAPREQWGEETGESYSDIASFNPSINDDSWKDLG